MLERVMAILVLVIVAVTFFVLSQSASSTGVFLGYGALSIWAWISAGILVFKLEDKL